jgi:hypothetical protein
VRVARNHVAHHEERSVQITGVKPMVVRVGEIWCVPGPGRCSVLAGILRMSFGGVTEVSRTSTSPEPVMVAVKRGMVVQAQ